MIYITNLNDAPSHVDELRPGRVISLLSPGERRPRYPSIRRRSHHHVEVHDISQPLYDNVLPGPEHVVPMVAFIKGWRPEEGALLIHCFAGVSRSTAAALIALVVKANGREVEAASHLRSMAPHALPNARMIEVADDALGYNGRLIAACQAMRPATPTFTGPLVRLPLLIGR